LVRDAGEKKTEGAPAHAKKESEKRKTRWAVSEKIKKACWKRRNSRKQGKKKRQHKK